MDDYNLRVPMPDADREKIGFHVCEENRNINWNYTDDRELASSEHKLNWYLTRAEVVTVNSANEIIDALKSQDDTDIDLLEDAVRFVFPETAKFARELLRHFLDNKRAEKFGHTVKFKIWDLLSADSKASERIYNGIITRIRCSSKLNKSLSYLIDKSQYAIHNVWRDQIMNHDLLPPNLHYPITLRQSEYSTLDWHLALGTFWVNWESCPLHRTPLNDLGTSRDPNRFVWVGGEKEVWRWHSETDRADMEVQQAGARLAKSGRGKYFRVVAEPCLMDLLTGLPISKSSLLKPPLTLPRAN